MSNLNAREALQRANKLFVARPEAAKKSNSQATAVWRDGLRCEIAGPSGESAITDMPSPMGGNGAAPNPGWLLRASMASCAGTAIAMRAAMDGIELSSLEVSVSSASDARGLVGIDGTSTALTDMHMSIKIGARDAPEAQLRALATWGEAQSPVGSTLRYKPTVPVDVFVV